MFYMTSISKISFIKCRDFVPIALVLWVLLLSTVPFNDKASFGQQTWAYADIHIDSCLITNIKHLTSWQLEFIFNIHTESKFPLVVLSAILYTIIILQCVLATGLSSLNPIYFRLTRTTLLHVVQQPNRSLIEWNRLETSTTMFDL